MKTILLNVLNVVVLILYLPTQPAWSGTLAAPSALSTSVVNMTLETSVLPAQADMQMTGDTAANAATVIATGTTEVARLPGPVYTDDVSVWPNAISKANSDPWIVQYHDRIRRMEPRLLVIDMTPGGNASKIRAQTRQLIRAIRESSRYHGYRDSAVSAFLCYEVFKYVSTRDIPLKAARRAFDYGALFTERYARLWNVRDPRNPRRMLRLDELIDAGYVHEVWFFFDTADQYHCFECVEMKPRYDVHFRRIADAWCQAGNGGDNEQPWIGRSVRINALNIARGIGCAFENLGHSLEGMSNSGAIPYFTRYFREYAMLDLDTRYGLPFNSYYALAIGTRWISHPTRTLAAIKYNDATHVISNYVAAGGNVHFPPNAQQHYDMDNAAAVASTIEDWRCGNGVDGKDRVVNWTNRAFARYRNAAPDCMGAWLIYWRQNMPGLDNGARDDNGKPMKNWWPFLFY